MRSRYSIHRATHTRHSPHLHYIHSTRHLFMGVLYIIVGIIQEGLRYTGNTSLFPVPFHYVFVLGCMAYGIFRIYRGIVLWRQK